MNNDIIHNSSLIDFCQVPVFIIYLSFGPHIVLLREHMEYQGLSPEQTVCEANAEPSVLFLQPSLNSQLKKETFYYIFYFEIM